RNVENRRVELHERPKLLGDEHAPHARTKRPSRDAGMLPGGDGDAVVAVGDAEDAERRLIRPCYASNCVFGLYSAGRRSSRNCFGTSFPAPMAFAAISPKAGESLKPWPEPPPRSQTFFACGWRSTMRLPSGLFSYWHTSADRRAAWASGGKRSARNARARSTPAGVATRVIVVGSIVSPRVSS